MEHDVQLERNAGSITLQPNPGSLLAEPDQLRICPGAWREPLGRDVQRLEEIRLAGAVRADEQDEPGLEGELERGIRAEVP
jgi:hypothetical protein